MSNKRDYILIKWVEYSPKWDVVPIKSIVTGEAIVGAVVEVSWAPKSKAVAKAEILGVGEY